MQGRCIATAGVLYLCICAVLFPEGSLASAEEQHDDWLDEHEVERLLVEESTLDDSLESWMDFEETVRVNVGVDGDFASANELLTGTTKNHKYESVEEFVERTNSTVPEDKWQATTLPFGADKAKYPELDKNGVPLASPLTAGGRDIAAMESEGYLIGRLSVFLWPDVVDPERTTAANSGDSAVNDDVVMRDDILLESGDEFLQLLKNEHERNWRLARQWEVQHEFTLSNDFGAMSDSEPVAAINTVSVNDIQEAIHYASKNKLKIRFRGGGFSQNDQAVAPGGLLLWVYGATSEVPVKLLHDEDVWSGLVVKEHESIVEVPAATTLYDLHAALYKRGLQLKVTPEYLLGSVGGVVSTNAYGVSSIIEGSFNDHVEAVKVVMTNGTSAWAGRKRRADLFRGSVSGLGMVGAIESVRLRVEERKPYVLGVVASYTNLERFINSLSWLNSADAEDTKVVKLLSGFSAWIEIQVPAQEDEECPECGQAVPLKAEATYWKSYGVAYDAKRDLFQEHLREKLIPESTRTHVIPDSVYGTVMSRRWAHDHWSASHFMSAFDGVRIVTEFVMTYSGLRRFLVFVQKRLFPEIVQFGDATMPKSKEEYIARNMEGANLASIRIKAIHQERGADCYLFDPMCDSVSRVTDGNMRFSVAIYLLPGANRAAFEQAVAAAHWAADIALGQSVQGRPCLYGFVHMDAKKCQDLFEDDLATMKTLKSKFDAVDQIRIPEFIEECF